MTVPDFSRVDIHASPASGANGMGWADLVAAQTGESHRPPHLGYPRGVRCASALHRRGPGAAGLL